MMWVQVNSMLARYSWHNRRNNFNMVLEDEFKKEGAIKKGNAD